MNDLQFTGRITEVKPARSGEGQKGPWANVEFEVTESNPQNPDYPQVGLFDLFKNGEYVSQATNFAQNFPVGTEVTVSFNMKKSTYQKKDGSGEAAFYKTSAWKVDKVAGGSAASPAQQFEPAGDLNEEDFSDLPF